MPMEKAKQTKRQAIMSKKIILWLSLCASVLVVAGLSILIPSLVFFARWTCERTGSSSINCNAAPESLGAGFWSAIAILIVGSVVFLIAWLGALVRAARMQDWIWFIILLIGSGIATVIYGFVGPDRYPLTATYLSPAGYPPSERVLSSVGPERNDARD